MILAQQSTTEAMRPMPDILPRKAVDRADQGQEGTSPALADLTLAKRAIAGDEQAFAQLYATHRSHVRWLCTHMIFDTMEAEDLTQDVFFQVYRKLDTFRGEASLSTWIHRVTVNAILMHLRKRKRRLAELSLDTVLRGAESGEAIPREFSMQDTVLAGAVDRIALERAIANLAVGYRICFVLHDVEGYDHEEVARMMDFTQGCSKSQVHKARVRIRRMLEGEANAKVVHRTSQPPRKEEQGPAC